jgi:Ricin-type beta-trefoil lectin domain-like
MTRTIIKLSPIVALVVCLAVYGVRIVQANHYNNPDAVQAPFAGKWGDGGSGGGEKPYTHPIRLGSDWSVDYYAVPGTAGYYRAQSTSGTVSGNIDSTGSACSDPNLNGGRQYRVQVQNTVNGSRGHVWYLHVSNVNPSNGQQYNPSGAIPNNYLLGWTYQFPNSNCYQVSTASGVHLHIEMFQSHAYSCFRDYNLAQSLTSSSILGKIGSNGLNTRTPCGSYIAPENATSQCFQPQGGSTANSTPIVRATCNGAWYQQWEYVSTGDGYYLVRLVNTNKCMEVLNWATNDGATIGIYDCHSGNNQRWGGTWGFVSGNPAAGSHTNKYSGKVIDAYGTTIYQWGYNGSSWQFMKNPP